VAFSQDQGRKLLAWNKMKIYYFLKIMQRAKVDRVHKCEITAEQVQVLVACRSRGLVRFDAVRVNLSDLTPFAWTCSILRRQKFNLKFLLDRASVVYRT